MPTRGRIHLLTRAVRSYCAQTYPNRFLVLLVSGGEEEAKTVDTLYGGRASEKG